MTRAPKNPRPEHSVELLGDIHIPSMSTGRRDSYINDLGKRTMVDLGLAAHVQVGDMTTNGISSEDADVLGFLARIPDGVQIIKALGNHDLLLDVRTVDQAAAALGLPARNYYVDLGFVYLVIVYPGDNQASYNNGAVFSASCLSWLDTTLQTLTDKDVWVICHFPIYDTVLGDTATHWTSTDSGFYVATLAHTADSSDVLALLDSYPQVKLWASGHTHSSLDTPGLFTMVNTGSRQVACVNASSVTMPNKNTDPRPLHTMYVTWRDDSSIEIRPRNHNAGGYWDGVQMQRVTTLVPT